MQNPIDGPLVRELREIGAGQRAFPKTDARRHHYVPAFLLAQFAEPRGDRRSFMAQIDVNSGRPRKTTPNDACFAKDLYTQHSDDGRDNSLEAFFSVIERHSAPAIQRLLDDPLAQTPEDRETLSYYLAFQYSRSPVVLAQLGNMSEGMSLAMFAVHMEDAIAFRRVYREAIEEEASDEEIESFRQDMQERMLSGAMRMSDPKAQAFGLMLSTADAIAETIHQMQWTLVEAAEDEFIISDRALAMHDPTPRFPWSGHALRSSPNAQTTIPLGSERALLLEDGPPRIGRVAADSAAVRKINLRTYGWAEQYIYGRNQQIVQRVRRQAKRFPREVVRPRPMRQVILEAADPDDPTVGREHVRRGWPRGLWVRDDDGRPQFVAYTVFDADEVSPGQLAIDGAAIGRRIIGRAIAEGLASPDHLAPSPSEKRTSSSGQPESS